MPGFSRGMLYCRQDLEYWRKARLSIIQMSHIAGDWQNYRSVASQPQQVVHLLASKNPWFNP
jgi:hypothetical protein